MTWRSGHCNQANPPEIHRQCRGVSDAGPCCCDCHNKPVAEPAAGVVLGLDETVYHADPIPTRLGGSLSVSGAKVLLSSPARFKWERDNKRPEKRAYDFGHAVHKLVLGVGGEVVVVDADSWRAKASQDTRDAAYDAGKVPLLTAEYATAQAAAESVLAHPLGRRLFEHGNPEASMFLPDTDTGVWRRGRLDWLPDAHNGRMIVPDLKTTISANPAGFGKSAADFGYHMQAAWYLDLIADLGLADEAAFVFVLVEKTPPFLVSVVELDTDAMRLGRQANRRALALYAECQGTNTWPGYSDDVELVSLPYWYTRTHDMELIA